MRASRGGRGGAGAGGWRLARGAARREPRRARSPSTAGPTRPRSFSGARPWSWTRGRDGARGPARHRRARRRAPRRSTTTARRPSGRALNRARTRFTAGARDPGLGAHQHRRHGTGASSPPAGPASFVTAPSSRAGRRARDLVLRPGGRRDRGRERRPARRARDAGGHGGRRARAVRSRRGPAGRRAGGRGPRAARATGARPSTCRCAPAPASWPWRRACWRGSIRPRRPCWPGRPRATPGWARSRRRPSPGRPCGCGRRAALVAVAVRAGGRACALLRVDPGDGRRRHGLARGAACRGSRWAAEPWRWPTGGGCWPPARAPCARVGRGRGPVAAVAVDGRRLAPARARAGARGARDGGAPEAGAVRRLAAALAALVALAALAVLAGPRRRRRSSRCRTTTWSTCAGPPSTRASTPWPPPGRRSRALTCCGARWRPPGRPTRANPADPAYDWSRYDEIVRGLSARGISSDPRLLPHARRGPRAPACGPPRRGRPTGRASPARSPGATPARSPTPPARSCREVRHIEVWNEPNLPGFWMPQCRQRGGPGGAGLAAAPTPRCWRPPTARSRPRTRRSQVIGGRRGARPAARPRTCPRRGRRPSAASTSPAWWRDEGPPIDAWSLHLYPIGSRSRPSSCHRGARCPRSSERWIGFGRARRST